MTISFSGLASGLDTSSWVEALTSLRRAKITTLETKQNEVRIAKDSLANVKTYFNTFRTAVEKLTDAKFGISTMDIFTQNVTSSTNDAAVTSTATPEAEENSYNIKVMQIASGTEASSTYSSTVTTQDTANKYSKLKSILNSDGQQIINSGTVFVTVDDITRSIQVDSNETINSLVNKLNDIGVDASYNEHTGKLNMNVSLSDIDEGSTNIINALHLSGVNKGYQSNKLQYETTETKARTANGSTKLSELGFGVSFDNADSRGIETIIISNSSGGTPKTIEVDKNTTMDNLISSLNDAGLYASLSKEGVLEITGGEITGGTFDAINIFGLSQNTNSAMVVGNNLTTILSDPNVIDLQTRLVEDLGVTRGYFEITTTAGDKFYEKVYSGMTVSDLMSGISNHGLNTVLDAKNGKISITGGTLRTLSESEVISLSNDIVIQESDENMRRGTNLLTSLGYSSGDSELNFNNVYSYNSIDKPSQVIGAVLSETKLADIITNGEGYKAGLITVVKDNIQYNISLSEDDTFGGLMETLSAYGFDSVLNEQGQLIIQATGDSRLQNYTVNASDASNILDILGVNSSDWSLSNSYLSNTLEVKNNVTEYFDADEDTLLSDISRIAILDDEGDVSVATGLSSSYISNLNGNIELVINDESNILNVSSNETVGTLLDKFRSLGLEATITDGNITIHSGYNTLKINSVNENGSKILSSGLLQYNDNLGGYISSSEEIISTTTSTEDLSASAWANKETALSSLNIRSGTFSVFRDGMKANVTISNNDTFASLENKINNDFKHKYGESFGDIELSFEHGHLLIKSTTDAVVSSGASTDTSNISSIAGLTSNADGYVKSSYELYKANISSNVTKSGIFRNGNVTEGDFIVGSQKINVTSSTTVNDIISMINSSEESGAFAYWDDVYGKLAIKSTIAGATLVNIEAGKSNFTDVMGFTSTERDSNNNILNTSLNTDAQVLGGNALFMIDGTTYSSNSNTVGSEVTRIQGLTINLKDVTENEEIITINKDVDTVSAAMEDVVTAYNELMAAVDEEISIEGNLSDQTTLKMIRNQLRNYMTGSQSGATLFRNMDAIGVCVDAASSSNISTSNSSIVQMSFDTNKFRSAFLENSHAVKYLLIGDSTNDGILTKIESLIESSLEGVSGYFDTQANSYSKQIQTLSNQISKANREILTYQEQLESKFSSMDILISNMQQQYKSFLTSS